VDEAVAGTLLPLLLADFKQWNVEVFADVPSYNMLQQLNYPLLQKADEQDYDREWLDYKCAIKIVEGLKEALLHIAEHSTKHSEAIVTEDQAVAETFLQSVDAAAVYHNASTRFTDGEEFGLGAEIGISTQKLHARGPFALEKLVTEKWVLRGNGEVR
jgi:glutamate-5-semialdehyde dehydrogenase